MKYRVHFVISNLGAGGAEMMLHKLLSKIDRRAFFPEVTSLTDFVPLADKFREIDVPVRIFKMARGVPDPRWIFRLAEVFRIGRPHLVQTWMYHADLIGGLAAKLARSIPVIWNIRHSNLKPHASKKMTRLSAKVCAGLSSYLPAKIVCCAETARQVHIELGYDSSKMIVIPNGFNLEEFMPNPQARQKVCRELGIPTSSKIIGLVARFHPQKDHRNFIRAAAACLARSPHLHFVLCGDGISPDNPEFASWIQKTGAEDRFHLLGRRSDMPAVTSAFDIACSASTSGEGFSNVLGEAMACGVPCVATDVGDAAQIVGETGRIVPPADPSAFADSLVELAHLPAAARAHLGALARRRVMENFSLDEVVARYERLYLSVLEKEWTEVKR